MARALAGCSLPRRRPTRGHGRHGRIATDLGNTGHISREHESRLSVASGDRPGLRNSTPPGRAGPGRTRQAGIPGRSGPLVEARRQRLPDGAPVRRSVFGCNGQVLAACEELSRISGFHCPKKDRAGCAGGGRRGRRRRRMLPGEGEALVRLLEAYARTVATGELEERVALRATTYAPLVRHQCLLAAVGQVGMPARGRPGPSARARARVAHAQH
jgi:hypothetical protein